MDVSLVEYDRANIGRQPACGPFQASFGDYSCTPECCLYGKHGLQGGPEKYSYTRGESGVKPKVIMRIKTKTTSPISASGKMVCTGAKSEQQSKLAARKDFKIQNIVASCDEKFAIKLEGLAYAHGHFSWKTVLTGAKVRDEIYEAFENIYPVLSEFMNVQQSSSYLERFRLPRCANERYCRDDRRSYAARLVQ